MAELSASGVLFWIVFAVWIGALFMFVKTEYGVPAVISTIAYFCLLQFVFHIDLINAFTHHPFYLLGGVLVYFGAGTMWSFFRWWVFVRERISEYLGMRDSWLEFKGQTQFNNIPDELKEDWAKYLDGQREYGRGTRKDLTKPPLVRNNKSKIMSWISFWPISAGLFIFEDMVKGIAKSIYSYIHDYLQNMANAMFKKSISKDLPENFK